MTEQNNPNEPETVSSLSVALTEFINYVGESQRRADVRLQTLEDRTFNRFAQVSDTLFDLTATVQDLAGSVVQLTEQVGHLTGTVEQVLDRIDEMQSEIRGLQTENRRILEQMERRLPPEELN